MINPGEHAIIFGMTGCGKSTLTRKIAALFSRRIIFDRLLEWESAGIAFATDFRSFKEIYQQKYQDENFDIFVRPKRGISQDELVELTNQILGLVYEVESYEHLGLALIFEEVWLYAPLHATPPWFQELLLTGRHFRISIIGNAQRPANVGKTIVSQARHVFVGQFFEYRDRKYFEDTFGRIPELANPPQKHTFWYFTAQQKPILISS